MRPERRYVNLVVTGLVLIGVASITAWFFANFERREVLIEAGPSAAARANPMLAAHRWLERLGIAVTSVAGKDPFKQLPPTIDTLVVNRRGPQHEGHRDALVDWVKQGGHLLVAGANSRTQVRADADLLAAFGVRQRDPDAEDSPPPDAPEGIEGARDEDGNLLAETVLGGETLVIALDPRWSLEVDQPPEWTLVAADRPRMIRLALGAGYVTVLADHRFMTNDAIGQHDHALMLAHLVTLHPGGRVWFLHDGQMPSLALLLWRTAPLALTSLAVLLLVWGWSLGMRLGPLEAPPERRRRDLLEHLEASAGFLWRHREVEPLVAATRARVSAAWERHRPALARLNPRARANAIADNCGAADPDAVIKALSGAPPQGEAALVEQAQRLAALWHAARGYRASAGARLGDRASPRPPEKP